MFKMRNKRIVWAAVVFALFYLFIAYQIPYTHDDWDWGHPIGIEQLKNATVNNRFLGNLIEVILTRSPVLKTLFMGMVFWLIPVIFVVLIHFVGSGRQNASGKEEEPYRILLLYCTANLLVLLMPINMWSQTYGWVAGFSNFVVSVLMVGLYQMVLCRYRGQEKQGFLSCFCCFILGTAIQLFLENITVCVLLVTLAAFFIQLFRNRRVNFCFLFLLAGNVLGTIIMFHSDIYGLLLSTGKAIYGYRTLTFSVDSSIQEIITILITRFAVLYPENIWGNNGILCGLIILLLMVLLWKKKLPGIMRLLFSALDLALICYLSYVQIWGRIQIGNAWWTNVVNAGLSMAVFLVVGIQTFVLKIEKTTRKSLIIIWIAVPAVVFPLTVIELIGARCFLLPYMLMVEFFLLLLDDSVMVASKAERRVIMSAVAAALLFLVVQKTIVYKEIGDVSRARKQEIEAAATGKKDSIYMIRFPHVSYLWLPDPEENDIRLQYFKAFYGIPEETEVIFESWEGQSLEESEV